MNKFYVWLRNTFNEFKWLIGSSKHKNDGRRYIYNGIMVPNKIYICRAQMRYGIVAVLRNYLFVYHWAKERGYKVVLDYEDRFVYEKGSIGDSAFWDEFFEQEITVKDALNNKGIVVGQEDLYDGYIPSMCERINGNSSDAKIHLVREGWREYYTTINQFLQPIWKPKQSICDKADLFWKSYLENKRCLAVAVRELFAQNDNRSELSDISKKTLDYHPLTNSIAEIIEEVAAYMDESNCNCIFLSTMQEDTCKLFKDRFQEKVFWIDRTRDKDVNWEYENMDKFCHMSKEEYYEKHVKNNSDYLISKNEGYIIELMLMARCTSLYAMPGGSAIGALMLNGGKYEDTFITDDKNKCNGY